MSRPESNRGRNLVSAFRGRRVLVVGDVMLDRFVWGEVNRISPEAPVPVVRVQSETIHLGGAANVAANLTALGAEASLAGVVGDDPVAGQLRAALEAERIGSSALVEDPRRTTTMKTRVIARAQQVVRVDRECDRLVAGEVLSRLVENVLTEMRRAEAVVVSDYDKGVVGKELLAQVLPRARSLGLPLVVDPKISHFTFYQPVSVLTPNQAEAARATATEIRSDEDCLAAAEAILARLDTQAVLVTRGERGMLLVERGTEPLSIAAVAREVYDVTGAGDTVVAVLALALSAGAAMREAAIVANQAAGIVVGKVGTATASPEELASRIWGGFPEPA